MGQTKGHRNKPKQIQPSDSQQKCQTHVKEKKKKLYITTRGLEKPTRAGTSLQQGHGGTGL